MNKTVVMALYDGEKMVGEVEVNIISPNLKLKDNNNRLRICYYSTPSERCPPLAVVCTIGSKVCLKMEESKSNNHKVKVKSNNFLQLSLLHQTLLGENKTAVVSLGGDEMHLVAMCSRRNDTSPCFWGFIVPPGLYESCLVMLNLRCLSIVFDLDETLIVANTLRSFEDKLEAIQRRLNTEKDPARIAGMISEIKRYQDDRNILKQYAESDQVVENGKIIKAESEVVPALSDRHQRLLRPIIRLQEKNIILTRINPMIRDTSVLVRMRPAWEDLRSYLFAKGRKRFEVYVCTMAEREYALEMWRLLDPDSSLITVKELSKRIVCVNSVSKKSLVNVFQDGNCHPKMALVIDDRLKVWDERDQPRVHAVPAFAPYYAPQAEENCAVPVLRVARNVACNVRGGFFRDFDEGLLQRINEVAYEDEIKDILPPDVSNYLESEGDACGLNGSKEPVTLDGIADAEGERRLKEATSSSTVAPVATHLDHVLKAPILYNPSPAPAPTPAPAPAPAPAPMSIVPTNGITINQLLSVLEPLTQTARQEPSLHSSPAREEGELPESELDSDTRRRLLILQHGKDIKNPVTTEPPSQFPVRPPPMQVPAPRVEPRGGWFPLGEDTGPQRFNRISPSHNEFSVPAEPVHANKKQTFRVPPFVPEEVHQRDDRLRLSRSPPVHPSFPWDEASFDYRDMVNEMGGNDMLAESPAEYLHFIASKCGTKVEFRPSLVPSTKLHFSFEVWFAGEKIGDATGRTRREAHRHAAESSLKNLADKYLSCLKSGEVGKFISEGIPKRGSIAALSELCTMEGLGFTFQPQPHVPNRMHVNNELYAQVEIDGEVWGKGVGLTWDEAKMQAAETAFQNLKAKIGQYPKKRQLSSRSSQEMPTKRFRPEDPRVMQRMATSARYS